MMTPLHWAKQPLTHQLARELRAATRRHPQIDGHTFGFADLKELWCAADVHVVCTHEHDPVWQYYRQTPDGGWMPVSVHPTMAAAMAAADGAHGPTERQDGTYLLARFGTRPWMRVRITSRDGIDVIGAIFDRLGAQTKLERIEAAA